MWPGPYGEWGSRKYLIASLNQSLKRMQLEYVDIFYSHRPDPDTPLEETMMTLDSVVRQGKALYVGISNYKAEEAKKAIDILERLGTPCLIHQPKYSMFERWVEDGLLDLLGKKRGGLHSFLPPRPGNAYRQVSPWNSFRLPCGKIPRVPADKRIDGRKVRADQKAQCIGHKEKPVPGPNGFVLAIERQTDYFCFNWGQLCGTVRQ